MTQVAMKDDARSGTVPCLSQPTPEGFDKHKRNGLLWSLEATLGGLRRIRTSARRICPMWRARRLTA